MNTSISKKDLKLLLYTGGILILIVGYFLGWKHFQQKQETLSAESETLTQELNKLNDIYMNGENYKNQTAVCNTNIQQIYDSYPVEVKEEDAILYARDLEQEYDITISNVGIAKANQLYLLGSGAVDAQNDTAEIDTADASAGTDTTTADTSATASSGIDGELGLLDASQVTLPQLALYNTEVTYDFTVGYEDGKSVFASILAYADKRNVPSISLSYDGESGKLSGNMTVNMYYMTGREDAAYKEPSSGVHSLGVKNIFGTIKNQQSGN